MTSDSKRLPTPSTPAEVARFVAKIKSMPVVRTGSRGRLIFAMDATASREPTWDRAIALQGGMFTAAASLGGLDVQLVWYRGFGEFEASPWVSNSSGLVKRMTGVFCAAGQTQIASVLKHAVDETRRQRVNAMVFVGDCMEEEIDTLCHLAGELGLLGVPAFMFHEGDDPVARRAFKEIARLTKGAYCPFDAHSADALRELLAAVAAFAAGGRAALEDLGRRRGGVALQITHQLR